MFWNEENKDDISTTTFQLTSENGVEPVVNVLQAIVKAFNINDAGDVNRNNIVITDLQSVYKEMVIVTPKEGPNQLKRFLRTKLKPSHRQFFDLVHKVLSQTQDF